MTINLGKSSGLTTGFGSIARGHRPNEIIGQFERVITPGDDDNWAEKACALAALAGLAIVEFSRHRPNSAALYLRNLARQATQMADEILGKNVG